MEEINDTTRMYPRTLQEAFPKDYLEDWFEPPHTDYGWTYIVGVIMWIGLAYYFCK